MSTDTLDSITQINKELGRQIEELKSVNKSLQKLDMDRLKLIATRQQIRVAARAKHKRLGTTKGSLKSPTAIDDLNTVLEMLGVKP